MNVTGFHDAYVAAIPIEIAPDLIISIASLPAIAILKIFAWVDRRNRNKKDAIDLQALLCQYHVADNLARIYDEEIVIMEAVEYNIELAGAHLLGRDAYALATQPTRLRLKELLSQSDLVERLVEDMAGAIRTEDDALSLSRARLEQFIKGFNL